MSETLKLARKAQPDYGIAKRLQVSDEAIDFMQNLIQKDPKKRLTATQALQHSFLSARKTVEERPSLKMVCDQLLDFLKASK